MKYSFIIGVMILGWLSVWNVSANGTENEPAPVKHLLLIGGPFDHHPKGTHEYMTGMRIIAKCLESVDGLQTRITNSEKDWSEGPGMIASADGIVLFREQGARWMQQDPDRLAAFEGLCQRGGGCVALHFGMGTVAPEFIERFVALFGGCHGGPDRKDETLDITARVGDDRHPICRGLQAFDVHDEIYHHLKFVKRPLRVTPIIQTEVRGSLETIAWAWPRPDGGRSFGFSGLHYHENWRRPEYRRLVTQGILWTLNLSIPAEGVKTDVSAEVYELIPAKHKVED